ncbi:MAG: 50S ribosomal protein L24 [Sedimentisphaerales bacterium]|nr:50S ribosomal protein L24 [Sedimentisphaerales bacterium]
MSIHVKKGDIVEVIAGDDSGTRGRVLSVNPVRQVVVVEGVNRVYKHVRPSRRNPQGGRLHVERPIHISNVLPVSTKTDRASRVHFVTGENGKKLRVGADGQEISTVRHVKS